LRYHLAWRALVWYLRSYHRLASKVLKEQLFAFYDDDEIWNNCCFYNPAFRMLFSLRDHSPLSFWDVRIDKASKLVRDALFAEASGFWVTYKSCPTMHLVHPVWKGATLSKICHSRFSNSLFQRCILDRAKLNGFLYKISASSHPNCSLGCLEREDLNHVLFTCPKRLKKRKELKKKFKDLKIEFNLKNIFDHAKTQIYVEKFILDIFS